MRLTICLCVLLLSGAAGFAAEVKPAWQVEWEKTAAAAEKEGQVTPYIFDQGPVTVEVVQAGRFPGGAEQLGGVHQPSIDSNALRSTGR